MKFAQRIKATAASGLLVLSLLVGLAPPQIAHAAAQTCTWVGTAGDNKFSTATNWSNCGGGVPLSGDVIRFTPLATTTTADVSLTNDLGVDLGGVLAAVSDSEYVPYKYEINAISFVHGASITTDGKGSTCFTTLTPVSMTSITGKGDLYLNESVFNPLTTDSLNIVGNLTVTNSWMSIGAPLMVLAKGTAKSIIVASKLAPLSSVDPSTCRQGGAGSRLPKTDGFAGMTYNSLIVENDAYVTLADSSKPITLGGGSGKSAPEVSFLPDWDDNNPVATTIAWKSAITLLGNANVYVEDNVTVNYTGAITGSGFSLTKDAISAGTFNFSPSANNTTSTIGIQRNPVKSVTLSGDTTDYITVVDNETAVLTGSRAYVSVLKGGTLKGTGVAKSGIYIENGAIIAPGNSPGCITSDTLSLNGEYQFELGGLEPCSEYDQLKVINKAAAADAVTIGDTATLTTTRFEDYTPEQGDKFIIIDQAGDKAVKGTFKDLPEGATFEQNGIVFKISYKGGDGNDVTLTVQNAPTTPDTGLTFLTSHPLITLTIMTTLAAGIVLAARRLQTVRARS